MIGAERESNGIIPADAGSTDELVRLFKEDWDHPRGCGEHGSRLPDGDRQQGSSPRMRGAPGQGSRASYHAGIIPADAGSTQP